jgi:hypothetical protein
LYLSQAVRGPPRPDRHVRGSLRDLAGVVAAGPTDHGLDLPQPGRGCRAVTAQQIDLGA